MLRNLRRAADVRRFTTERVAHPIEQTDPGTR
jgi:hypothetical protein